MSGPGRKPNTSDEEILRAIALHPDKVVTSSDISESIGMTNAGVNKRLADLVEEGYVVRKEVGARAVIYWLSSDGKQAMGRD